MQKIMKNMGLMLVVLLSTTSLFGQRDLTLYSMNNMSQSLTVNPAFRPKTNVYVNLPLGMQTFGFTNSGFGAADLFTADQKSFVSDDSFLNQ